jgi:ketosteroid isomerase-like protein
MGSTRALLAAAPRATRAPRRSADPAIRLHDPVDKGKRKGRICYASANSSRVLQQRLAIIGSIARERGGTMEQSNELRDLTLRFYKAVNTGDVSFVERHVSRQEGAVFVGTDPNEWWEGYAAFVEAIRSQEEARGAGGPQIEPGQIQAYREGSVGWVMDHDSFRLPDGTEVPFRNSAVFLQEDGEWKLIHAHASIGVRNEEMFGEGITAS